MDEKSESKNMAWRILLSCPECGAEFYESPKSPGTGTQLLVIHRVKDHGIQKNEAFESMPQGEMQVYRHSQWESQ